jgi:cell division protein FtsQ
MALTDLGERSAFIARQRLGRPGSRGRRERPRRLARWARRVGFLAAALLVLALQALAVHWVFTTPRFAITAVEVRGAARVPTERILDVAGVAPGTNLWRVDSDAVVGRLEALPEIRRAELIRELPGRVTILVEERRPFTLVHGNRLHWMDEEGRVLGEERQAVVPPVPVITGLTEDEVATMRTEPSPKARAAIALIRTLLRSGSPLAAAISEIDMSRREGPVLWTVDGIEVRLGTEDWEERLARLEGVLSQVASEEGAVSAIDLRFRDQVVLKRGGQG